MSHDHRWTSMDSNHIPAENTIAGSVCSNLDDNHDRVNMSPRKFEPPAWSRYGHAIQSLGKDELNRVIQSPCVYPCPHVIYSKAIRRGATANLPSLRLRKHVLLRSVTRVGQSSTPLSPDNMSSPINSPNPSTPPTHDKARDQSRHSQTMTKPEVFFYAERLTELTRLKCFHGHLTPISRGYPRPASCPRCYYRVQDMAELFYQTCPGDWQGDGAFLKECLKAAAWGNTNPDLTIDIGAFVSYRWKLILLADQLIKDLGLPVPGNQTCAMWNEYVWRGEVLYNLEGFWEKCHWVWDIFAHDHRMPEASPEQGPDFERFRRYLAASVMQADLPFKPTLAMIDRVVDYVGRAKNGDADFRLRWQTF